MGQGKEVKTRQDPQVEIQERGEIFFFYRPKVNKEEVHSVDDVQRLYIVMRPESGENSIEEKQDPHSGKEGSDKSSSSSSGTRVGIDQTRQDGSALGSSKNLRKLEESHTIVMMNEFVPQRTAAYIGQNDVHIGEMTVRETSAYAARFQGVGSRYGEFQHCFF